MVSLWRNATVGVWDNAKFPEVPRGELNKKAAALTGCGFLSIDGGEGGIRTHCCLTY